MTVLKPQHIHSRQRTFKRHAKDIGSTDVYGTERPSPSLVDFSLDTGPPGAAAAEDDSSSTAAADDPPPPRSEATNSKSCSEDVVLEVWS